MALQTLKSSQLRHLSDPALFQNNQNLDNLEPIIGQPRAVRALKFGLGIQSPGYNIFILGETNPGHMSTIERFLTAHAESRPVPNEWVYVHNFEITHQARAISLPAGDGGKLKADMEELVSNLKRDLPEAFETEAYRNEAESIRLFYNEERDSLVEELREQAGVDQLTVVDTATGFLLMPLIDGKAMSSDEYNSLPIESHRQWEKKRQGWDEELEKLLRKLRELDQTYQGQMNELNRSVAGSAIKHYFERLEEKYEAHAEVTTFIEHVYENVLDSLTDFFQIEHDDKEVDLRRYSVNLLVNHAESTGAPVIFEHNPRYHTLFGRIEYESQHTTHFTNIKPGALHRANGGYLILNVHDILKHQHAWDALKRALKTNKILLQPNDRADGNQVLSKSLDPEPIPLNVKVILLGSPQSYYRLLNRENDFEDLFKVKAEFAFYMKRSAENELAYAGYIQRLCEEEGLRPFAPDAIARVVDYSSRLCEHQHRLLTYFEPITDLVREASFWASLNAHEQTMGSDVLQALEEKRGRTNLDEMEWKERILEGRKVVTTTGSAIGQINGLSVHEYGDVEYGFPSRITVRTYQGEHGLVHIERETDMADSSHNKGLLIITGFLGGQYAQTRPLTLSASITFEQSYGGVSGDSASAAELYAVLSSIGQIPIKQNIAITGSVSQNGEVQTIGAVNQKIEGFFDICDSKGLTGTQGVVIPAANQTDLMLRDDVVAAVEAGRFHIWAIDTIEDGIELFTCKKPEPPNEENEYPENSFHALVMKGLERLDKNLDEDDEDDDEDEDDEDESKDDEKEKSTSKEKVAAD